jgi:hypothetical protein
MSDSRRFVEGKVENGCRQCWINLKHCEVLMSTASMDKRLEKCMGDNVMKLTRRITDDGDGITTKRRSHDAERQRRL